MPGLLHLLSMGKEGVELQDGETSVQTMLIEQGEGITAVIVTVNADMKIIRKIRKYPINDLLKGFDIKKLKAAANERENS
jgi:hypothetical protein